MPQTQKTILVALSAQLKNCRTLYGRQEAAPCVGGNPNTTAQGPSQEELLDCSCLLQHCWGELTAQPSLRHCEAMNSRFRGSCMGTGSSSSHSTEDQLAQAFFSSPRPHWRGKGIAWNKGRWKDRWKGRRKVREREGGQKQHGRVMWGASSPVWGGAAGD